MLSSVGSCWKDILAGCANFMQIAPVLSVRPTYSRSSLRYNDADYSGPWVSSCISSDKRTPTKFALI